jgi:hypothetical protein
MNIIKLIMALMLPACMLLMNPERAGSTIIGEDNRVSSNYKGIGRTMTGGVSSGTAWILLNGALVTAKHVPAGRVEFNVPQSENDGTINHPGNQDIYSPDLDSFITGESGLGYDYKIFLSLPNTITGLFPLEAQKAFLRVYDSGYPGGTPPTQVVVTGYGMDDDCNVYGCTFNSDNRTQQTATGPFGALVDFRYDGNGIMLYHQVDTENGNSGSPVILPGTNVAIGMHAQGIQTCDPINSNDYNCGPSFFRNTGFINGVNSLTPPNTVYVDRDHPAAGEDGTVFQPFHTVAGGVNNVPEGGDVGIVSGTYSDRITINKAMKLVAPLGGVIIGQ